MLSKLHVQVLIQELGICCDSLADVHMSKHQFIVCKFQNPESCLTWIAPMKFILKSVRGWTSNTKDMATIIKLHAVMVWRTTPSDHVSKVLTEAHQPHCLSI